MPSARKLPVRGLAVPPVPSPSLSAGFPFVVGLLIALGCDGGAGLEPDPKAEPPAPPDLAVLDCSADVIAGEVRCHAARPRLPIEVAGALIIGGQGRDILLESRDVCYQDGCDPAAPPGVFQADVTVRNLTSVALGTTDGSSPHVDGVRVFFQVLPAVAATSDGEPGTVSVIGADGTATFTASDQPYHQYDEVLRPGAKSRAKRWRWQLSPNATAFEFGVLVAAKAAEPAPAPFVVFDMVVDGNRDIYRVRLDGTDLQPLTTSPADDRGPTVVGETVVFTSFRDGNGELYSLSLADAEAAPVRITNSAASESQPALSPDGTRLAFMRDVSGVPRLWVAAADGSGEVAATAGFGHGGSIEGNPSWAPDGDRLVFMSTTRGTADLYILHVETGVIAPLLATSYPEVEPSWSPDGDHIVFVSNRDGPTRLYRVEVETGAVEPLTTGAGSDGHPAYLPDGRIVYRSTQSGAAELRWIDPTAPDEVHVIPLPEGTAARPGGG